MGVLVVIAVLAVNVSAVFAEEDLTVDMYRQTIAAGQGRGYAISSSGELMAWGAGHKQYTVKALNTYLGTGGVEDELAPVCILNDVVSVSSSKTNSVAITKDGWAWTWGNNTYGQLGNGTTEDQLAPIKILENVVFAKATEGGTWFIKNDATLWISGITGSSSSDSYVTNYGNKPVKFMDDVMYVDNNFAIKTNNELWAWGRNQHGNIGDGTTEPSSPKKIMGDVVTVSADNTRVMAVKKDGSLWFWGRPETTDTIATSIAQSNVISSPIKIMDGVLKAKVAETMFVIGADNILWAWGSGIAAGLGTVENIEKNTVTVLAL